jgi:enoyl-CoA hydratase/3-hydroxyacyl-CoA dehydrogenase
MRNLCRYTAVAANMKNPERIVGAHFFSPAHVMQLFEIIRTENTPPQVLVDTVGLSKQIKKTPVVGRYKLNPVDP